MNKFQKILVTGFSEQNLDKNIWDEINTLAGGGIVFAPESDVDCLFCRFNKVDQILIDSFPQLKYIGLLATGTGTVDLEYAKKKNITVCNVPGYATESVAEWVFALILEYLRSLEKAKQTARSGDFSGDGFSTKEILGKKFGIIGLGRIGSRVAKIAQGFGAQVFYWSRNRKPEIEKEGIAYEALDDLVKTSDFISLHALTTKETEGILDSKRLNSIKPGAIIVNVSGMEQIDIPALEQRLTKGDITFILDHPDEMNPDAIKSLAKFPNCIVYPPIGYISAEAKINKQKIFVSNLKNYLKEVPTNKVN